MKSTAPKNVDSGNDIEARLEQVIAEYQSPLLRYVSRMIGAGYDEAQDIVQETFIRACSHWKQNGCESIANIKCWLYRVAHNLAMDAGRKRSRHRKMQSKLMNDPVLSKTNSSHSASSDHDAIRRESRYLAMHAVEGLPDEQRSVVLLRIMDGMTLREISAATGLKIGTVNYRLTQALRELSKKLQEAGAIRG